MNVGHGQWRVLLVTSIAYCCLLAQSEAVRLTTKCYIKETGTNLMANCSHLNLTQVPRYLPSNLTILDLSWNNVSRITNTSFDYMPRLYTLLLNNNLVDHFEMDALQNLPSLTVLDLNDNTINFTEKSLPKGLFRNLHHLTDLRLSNMDIKHDSMTYAEDTFSDLTNVRYLHIDTSPEPVFGKGFASMVALETLSFRDDCWISHITNNTFEVFSKLKVKTLNLANCVLAKVDTGAYKHFSSLENLNLHHTAPFGIMSTLLSLEGLQGLNITDMDLSHVAVWVVTVKSVHRNQSLVITGEMTRFLGNICVERLYFHNNNIAIIEKLAFYQEPFLSCIKFMDFSENPIIGELYVLNTLQSFVNLEFLNVSHPFSKVYSYDNEMIGRILIKNEKHFEVFDDRISILIPPSLKSVGASGYGQKDRRITNANISIIGGKHLEHLDISFSALSFENDTFCGIENLKYLDLSGNNLFKISRVFFYSLGNLETLILRNVHIDHNTMSNEESEQIFKPLINLNHLDLSSNGLYTVYENIFKSLIGLEKIYLTNNKLKDFPFSVQVVSNICHIDLSYNTISQISLNKRTLLNELSERPSTSLRINLQGNILACGCGALDFVAWASETRIQFVVLDSYECIDKEGRVKKFSKVIKNYIQYWRSCGGQFWLTFSFSLVFVFMSAFALSLLFARNSMRLKCFFLRLLGKDIQMPMRKDFQYDIFVYYSSKDDHRWVCNVFRQKMEVDRGLRLCIPDRDFGLGSCTAEEILEGINQSWKTVIYVTETFLEDELCSFTLASAVYASTSDMPSRIIVLYSSAILDHALPPLLTPLLDGDNAFNLDMFGETRDDGYNGNGVDERKVNKEWVHLYTRVLSWL